MLLKSERLHTQIVQFAQIALLAGMGLAPLLLSAAPAHATDSIVNPSPHLELVLESASADRAMRCSGSWRRVITRACPLSSSIKKRPHVCI
ncbi:hypothetical protein LP414_22140 [Polaromonas sp. P1(28)-13]|nr:hypothetical protein LP414_22140 [Polaromonas sp. P1(28)-13]